MHIHCEVVILATDMTFHFEILLKLNASLASYDPAAPMDGPRAPPRPPNSSGVHDDGGGG
jgi:hypothetical protein